MMFNGIFYENSINSLNKQIEECFNSNLGPGDLPVSKRSKKLFGIISPHAGYAYSGACQAWAYKEIAESEFPDVYVILGTNHNGVGKFSACLRNFESPFGVVSVDEEFGKGLMNEFKLLKEQSRDHLREHSIEVQLPFLQFVSKNKLSDLKILPILIGHADYEDLKVFGEILGSTNKKIIVIASSDFTHYGPNYGYIPFVNDKKENLYKLDNKMIEFILNLDSKGFLEYKNKMDATVCGANVIITAIETVKVLGCKKGQLLKYYTSGDVTKDYEGAVGYSGVVFR